MINIYATKLMIMNSKLFKTSSRQSEILAAVESPINLELVEQLDEYVPDEYKELTNPAIEEESQSTIASDPTEDEWGFDEEDGTSVSRPSPASFTPREKISDEYEDELSDLDSEPMPSAEDTSAVDSATKVTQQPVVCDSNLANSIKDTLNAVTATTGVSRVAVKGDEVWVHYSDNINLNNVLYPTIEACKILQFNRLARTENAVVFTV